MAKYIDAEEVKQAVMAVSGVSFASLSISLLTAIGKIPAADVEPVRHGRWNKPLDRRRRSSFYCSECKTITYSPWDYCPHCGAKMDGGGS